MQPFSGVISALVSPFKENDETTLDLEAFEKILRFQKDSGINGIVIAGTTGEAPTLTEEEVEELLKVAAPFRSKDFLIYVGSGTNDTKETLKLSERYLNKFSIDGLLIVTPYYNRPTQEGLIAHYSYLLDRLPKTIPVCPYNQLKRTGCQLEAQNFATLCSRYSNIVAIKEGSGNLANILMMKKELEKIGRKDVLVLTGDDDNFIESLVNGGDGIISVLSQAFPKLFLDILAEKNIDHLKQMKWEMNDMISSVYSVTNPIGIKVVLNLLKFCSASVRLPLLKGSEDTIQKIRKTIRC